MNIKHWVPSVFLVIIFLYSITACYSYVKPVDQILCDSKFPFIKEGKTSKADVLENLDIKDLRFKDKRESIWIYRIIFYEKNIAYDLVLVFDDNEILKKHSWVKTW